MNFVESSLVDNMKAVDTGAGGNATAEFVFFVNINDVDAGGGGIGICPAEGLGYTY